MCIEPSRSYATREQLERVERFERLERFERFERLERLTISPVIPVQTVMPEALAEILRRAPLSPEKVDFAWRTAVGGVVANATTAALDGGILRVRAKDPAWQREIERSAAVIRDRLGALLGGGVVRYIDVTVAPALASRPQTDAAAVPGATGPEAAAPAEKNSRSADESNSARRHQ